MASSWEKHLADWTEAGLITPAAAAAILDHEAARHRSGGLRWPVLLAIALGVLMLGAGILLFVAANWDRLSPGERFGLVLGMVGLLQVAGAMTASRFPALVTGFHAAGSIALGAGIFLAGQIFHLQAHWPGGLLLWLLGAVAGLVLLRDWPHVVLVALLVPAWLSGEWSEATRPWWWSGVTGLVTAGWLALAFTYLSAVGTGPLTPARRALAWIGGLAVIPATVAVCFTNVAWPPPDVPLRVPLLGWAVALGLPLVLAVGLRGRAAGYNLIAVLWVAGLAAVASGAREAAELAVYGLCALGSLGLIAWGLAEARAERINLGVAGFALTVVAFYFAEAMDRMDRSVSLIGLGVLFLVGGWLLEQARRRLVARLPGGRATP